MSRCVICDRDDLGAECGGVCEECAFVDDEDYGDSYEKNRRAKRTRNEGLESYGKGGNKSRDKRNKKITHRVHIADTDEEETFL